MISLDRAKLVKTLGMLGSDHDGEVAAAGRAADRLIREAGLRWPDIIPPQLGKPDRREADGIETVRQAVEFVLAHIDLLTEWEANFARSVGRARYRLSQKQIEVLGRLVEKCRRAEESV